MLIILAETVHGIARVVFLAPLTGDLRSRQIGVVVGSGIVLAIAWLAARWLGANSRRQQLRVGAFWVGLTVAFELVLGRATGLSWERIFSDYHPWRGGFMLAGLAVMLLAPLLAAKLRGIDAGRKE